MVSSKVAIFALALLWALAVPVFAQNACPVGGQIAISCPVINDAVVAQAVQTRLSGYAKGPNTDITASVAGGVVTLTGWAATQGYSSQAGILAGSVRGVNRVVNRINVCEAVGSDTQVMRSVMDTIRRVPYDTQQVHAYVANGVVFLSGQVDEDYTRTMVGDMVASVPGVAAVQNGITVKGLTTEPG